MACPMQRTAKFVVEEVRQADDAKALIEQAIEILDISLQRMRTFY